ncbi:hypothetical protein M011DRAFT_161338 [Sporormia fimetaria CBS 119925]|uniref:Transcription regulator Rua1 C-terminal domain-containing protein n=1 Tax=Sporormia fimetaria CBS 119925 TaxID=1340428 RepID=A0A6A6V489_9PLEO|nr:hypothetical protein M011DRAFT_161338 [Sporormia fimetaria CBS 119925]
MEYNALRQHHQPTNRPFSTSGAPSRHAAHMLYPYGSMPMQQQPAPPNQQPRPSPPYPSWAVPQAYHPYAHMQKTPVTGGRDSYEHMGSSEDVAGVASHSPAMSSTIFANNMAAPEALSTTDYFPGLIDTTPWGPKVCEELDAFPSLDPDLSEFNQGLMHHDENTPIIDLRQYGRMEQQDTDNMAPFQSNTTRRLSESSFSMSSTGGPPQEVSTYEDLGPAEAISYASDYEAWNSLEPTTNYLSPLDSPRRPQHDGAVRNSGRSRASPAPHTNIRSSPYTLESSRFKRWSTGHAPTSTPVARPLSQVQDRFAPYPPRLNPHHSMPAYPPNGLPGFGLHSQTIMYPQQHPLQSSNPTLFASPEQPFQLEVPRPLPSQGLFRLLQSNVDRHGGCSSHFTDLSDPPDLYSSLHEEPSNPPESDMNPSDPDLVPHEQDLRFGGDLYTPRWVRGHGNKREGWCGLCKPGRWLVLKNSAFWYDKSFTHGVSAATGAAFQGPQDTRRTEGNLDVWEGLCGSCGEWIALVSNKKKGTTWFRHAYKCHTHPKVKDGPKKRRETHIVRARAVSSASAASSSYPIKKETPQDTIPASYSNAESTSTPTPTSASTTAQQYVGMPTSLPATTQPTATFPIAPTSTFTPQPMSTTVTDTQREEEPVVGMFSSPLQPLSTFCASHRSTGASQDVSEPELVGVKTTAAFNSLASMI